VYLTFIYSFHNLTEFIKTVRLVLPSFKHHAVLESNDNSYMPKGWVQCFSKSWKKFSADPSCRFREKRKKSTL